MQNIPTPHISAKLGEIAKTVILPGDPLRAKKMAKKFLTDAKLVSAVRNNYCYTGTYNGASVSIMSTGMGPASMGIYSYELFKFYNVENAIRVGTIGSLNDELKIGDVIICKNAITDTNFNEIYSLTNLTKTQSSKKLFNLATVVAKEKNIKTFVGDIFTTDTFYSSQKRSDKIRSLDVVGVEMEGASLYDNAKKLKKNALCICTVSDEVLTGKQSSSYERENNFDKMFLLALEMATKL